MATAEMKQPRTMGKKVDAKQAARLSLDYFNELFPNAVISNVALEEVELLEDENCWLITLGFDEPLRHKPLAAINVFGPPPPARQFKIFKVDTKTAKVISMKIRKLD